MFVIASLAEGHFLRVAGSHMNGSVDLADDRSRASAVWWALPLLATVVAYSAAPSGGFVWDDHALIESEPSVQQVAPVESYFQQRFWNDPLDASRSFYRPLVTLSYALEWHAWKGSPAGFHVTNLLAHLGVLACVLVVCRRAGGRGFGTALVATAFAVFPRLTESVAWISGRTDVFAALFGLAALIVYRPLSAGWRRPVFCALLLVIAALCKEVAFVFFAALVVLEWCGEKRKFSRDALLRLLPSLAGLGAVLLARFAAVSSTAAVASGELPGTSVSVVLASLGHYARMIADPLRPELQIGLKSAPSPLMVMVGGGFVVAVAFSLWRVRDRLQPLELAAVTVLVGSVALVVNVLPLQMPGLAADRYLYVPLAMTAVLFARPVDGLLSRWPRASLLVAAPLLLAFVVGTHQRVLIWTDEYSLWKQAVQERQPGNTGPLLGLAGVLLDADLPERAAVHLAQQMQEESGTPQVKTWNTYAVALSKSGQHERAIAVLEQLAHDRPDAARVQLNLAMANARARRWDAAQGALSTLGGLEELRGTVANVLQQIDDAKVRAERLAHDRSVAGAIESAELADSLGSTFDAEALWRHVLNAEDATQEQRLRALGQLSFHGEPARVRADLERARAKLGGSTQFAIFERVVDERDLLR